jgi:hypothetical protein
LRATQPAQPQLALPGALLNVGGRGAEQPVDPGDVGGGDVGGDGGADIEREPADAGAFGLFPRGLQRAGGVVAVALGLVAAGAASERPSEPSCW